MKKTRAKAPRVRRPPNVALDEEVVLVITLPSGKESVLRFRGHLVGEGADRIGQIFWVEDDHRWIVYDRVLQRSWEFEPKDFRPLHALIWDLAREGGYLHKIAHTMEEWLR